MHGHGGAVLQLRHSNLPPSGSNCSAQVRFRGVRVQMRQAGVHPDRRGNGRGSGSCRKSVSYVQPQCVCVCVCESTGEERRANRGLFMYGSMLEKRP